MFGPKSGVAAIYQLCPDLLGCFAELKDNLSRSCPAALTPLVRRLAGSGFRQCC